MTAQGGKASDGAQIRALVEDLAEGVRAKDVERVVAHYAPDVVTFDLAPPLEFRGAQALRESLQAWFPTFRGPVGYQICDLSVTAGEDVALCRSLNRISGSRTDGEETGVWVRATLGLRKVEGKWKVAHEHASVPFYMDGSDRAAIDLEP